MAKMKQSKNGGRKKDQLTVVLEHINSKFDLVVESLQGTNTRVDRLENRMDNFEHRMDNFEHGQRLTLDYLARIEAELHGEMKTKVGMKEFGMLEKRVQRLERAALKK